MRSASGHAFPLVAVRSFAVGRVVVRVLPRTG